MNKSPIKETEIFSQYNIIKIISQSKNERKILLQNKQTKKLYVRHDLIFKEKFTKAYREETQKTLKSDHPNILSRQIFPIINNNMLCILTEHLDMNLDSIIKARKKEHFSEQKIAEWFTQICLAIKNLHDQNVLHRDLHPKNIFLNKETNFIKLGEFSFMKLLKDEHQNAITYVGENLFIAPEILIKNPYSFKADIWSLGIILFNLLTHKCPFDIKELYNIQVLKVVDSKKIIMRLPAKIFSNDIKSLVVKMLQGDPLKRPTINQVLLHEPILKTLKIFEKQGKYDNEFFSRLWGSLYKGQNKSEEFRPKLMNARPILLGKNKQLEHSPKSEASLFKKNENNEDDIAGFFNTSGFGLTSGSKNFNARNNTGLPKVLIRTEAKDESKNSLKEQSVDLSHLLKNKTDPKKYSNSDKNDNKENFLINQRENLITSLEMHLGAENANIFYEVVQSIFPNKNSLNAFVTGIINDEVVNILKKKYQFNDIECSKCIERLDDMLQILNILYQEQELPINSY